MNATAAQVFWWVALPYLALGVFAVGHVWRWRYDQFGWTSRSTQLQERRMLKWGSPLFHYGTFAAIGGHVIGVLIPEQWTKAIGIPENVYRWFSAGAGTLAAVLVIGGVIVLASRRLLVRRVRATTAPVDYVTLILLLIVILTGIAPTIGINLLGHGYDYRTTVAPWFRGLFIGCAVDRPCATHLPAARDRRVDDLGPMAVQPARARLELPAVVPMATLHCLPKPSPLATVRAGYRRTQMAQDRRPVLDASSHPEPIFAASARSPAASIPVLRAAPVAALAVLIADTRGRAFSDATVEAPVLNAGLGNDMNDERPASGCRQRRASSSTSSTGRYALRRFMAKNAAVQVRRVYDPPAQEDGTRVLVDRIWPRGLAKARATLDEWCKDIAPSTELRKWYSHDPERFEEFTRRYHAELRQPERSGALAHLRELAKGRTLTLLTATKQPEISEAEVLAKMLRG